MSFHLECADGNHALISCMNHQSLFCDPEDFSSLSRPLPGQKSGGETLQSFTLIVTMGSRPRIESPDPIHKVLGCFMPGQLQLSLANRSCIGCQVLFLGYGGNVAGLPQCESLKQEIGAR